MKKILKTILLISVIFSIGYIFQTNAASINTSVSFEGVIDGCTGNTCDIKSGSGAVKNILGGIIKYATFLVGLIAVLFIVVNGIMYSMGGMDQSMKEESKKRIVKTLIGIIVLLLSGTILNLVAPWIYK